MEVIYSICSHLGRGGIGHTAHQALRGIYRHEALKKVVARRAKKVDIPKTLIEKVWYPKRIKLPGISASKWYNKESLYFDYRVAALLKNEKCDIFHGWNGQSLASLRQGKSRGFITIVERASSHMLTQMKLLIEEYKTFGIKEDPELPEVIGRCLQEYESADYVLVPSQFAYDSFLENGFSENKLLQVPFGVDTQKFYPGEKKDSVFRILFAGKICFRKGVQYLLEAWSKLKLENAELILLGNSNPNIRPLLMRYQQKNGFQVCKYVSNPAEVFRSASLFVFPSLEEGSALVTYEALASGLPVITTHNSGSLVRDGKDGFIVPIRNAEALKEKIELLYNDREQRKKMAISSRERIKNFTWDDYGDRLVENYRKISRKN